MPLILPARTLDSGFNIDNSLRFNRDDNAYLEKTFSGSPTSTKICTISFWLKLADPSIIHAKAIFSAIKSGSSEDVIKFGSTNGGNLGYIELNFNNTGNGSLVVGDGSSLNLFRDPSAWYHFVIAFDTSQGTASNRIKFYQNGTLLQTESRIEGGSVTNDIAISQNYDLGFLTASKHQIGMNAESSNSEPFDGYLSEFHFVDGQQLAPTSFAETNDNGVWIPKDCKDDLTYGNYGFFLEFKQTGTSQNSSGIGADTSGNTNHYAPNNLTATDVTTDTPTNNFATMNSVHVSSYGSAALPTFSEGNLKIGMNSNSSTSSTIAPSKGKWYVEYKQSENTADNQGFPIVGISATLGGTGGDVIGFRTPDGTDFRGQLGTTSVSNAFGSARSANDIFGFYINLDDDILIVHKNGSDYMGSGASSGLNWSGGLTTTNEQTGFYHFYVQNNADGSPRYTDEVNFGNPTFSISSSNSDANGYGSFEFSPTLSGTAFFAMCTKNLAEYG